MTLDQLRSRLAALPGACRPTVEQGELWVRAPDLDVRAMADAMTGLGARLSTMTGIAIDEGESEVLYHYWLDGIAITFAARTSGTRIASITPSCPAADWPEREIHDYYAVMFEGHPGLTRLLLPDDLPLGLYREP